MDQFLLRNKFLNTTSNEDKRTYNTQKNYCLTLVRHGVLYNNIWFIK